MKKFLICLSLLFSFLFIGNVKAAFPSGWEDISTFTLPSGITPENYKIIIRKGYYNGTEYIMTVIPKNNNSRFQVTRNTDVFPNAYIIENLQPNNSSYYAKWYQADSSKKFVYKGTNDRAHKASYKIVYTNTDIYSSNGSDKWFSYDTLITSRINFHLNGGTIIDVSNPLNPQTYQGNFTLELNQSDLNTFINSQTPINGNSEFLGWYYDANFTQPYNSSDNISNNMNLYAKWETPITFNFHLNGGYLYDPSDGWGSEEDFSISLYNSEIEQFFTNLEVKKASMLFDGWFYDNNYKNIFHINDNFTEDTYNLYAKWRYEKVDDFLNNTTFNEYTFDTMYDYAIITKGDKLGDIYLGLNLNKYEITVYEYNENLSNYENEKGFCLVPIYSKNGTYYYNLDTSSTSYTEVLVLPKTVFENNNYSFLLTDNAYITYTNNLENTVIYDSNGNQINTNLEDTYQTFQDSMISDEQDLLTIFKNFTKFKDNNVFSNINTIWNKFKRTDLYTYFMILIVGGLIILIIKGAKRS